MKKLTILFTAVLFTAISTMAQVAINKDGSNPDASAILDVKSTEKGMLTPRMTHDEIGEITNPANGLIIFNTTDNRFYFYDDGAEEWKKIVLGAGTITPILTVTNPITGEIWTDRNLGASQVATSSTDSDAYGDLYQWGRLSDGHEDRSSGTTSTLSSTDVPGHSNFILAPSFPYDWRSPQNDNLWQGVIGTNNPCPSGFRLPTEAELNAERLSWATNNAAGAFGSVLKLTVGGLRYYSSGSLGSVGSGGDYWSSTVYGISARSLYFYSSNADMNSHYRAYGFSVRCIKD